MADKKKKNKEYHLSSEIRKSIFSVYVFAAICLSGALVMFILHFVIEDPYDVFFYGMCAFFLALTLFTIFRVALLPNEVTKMVNAGLTSDIMQVANNVSTSKEPLVMEKSGIYEFDEVKERVVDVFNSFRDVSMVDRDVDESYLKFGHEYGYDDLITRDSFLYNLPFILKLNAYSRGGLILCKITGTNPSKEAMNALAQEIRKSFATRVYLGFYSPDTIIGYVTDVESLPVFQSLLYRLYCNYSFAEADSQNKQKVYGVLIGASVYPYSLKNTMVSDALQALLSSKDVKIFMPNSLSYGISNLSSTDDQRRKCTLITDRLLSYLYKFGEGTQAANATIGTTIQELASTLNFEGCGLITRPVNCSPSDPFSCLRETGKEGKILFLNREQITLEELMPLYRSRDDSNCFYASRREDLNPDQAAFFDKYHLQGLFISFFGRKGKTIGATYLYSTMKMAPLSSVDTEVVKIALMVLDYLGINLLESSNSVILNNDLERVLKLDGRLRYMILPENFSLLEVSDSMKDLLPSLNSEHNLSSLKCYKALFNRDAPCENCPFRQGSDEAVPFTFANGRYTRRILSRTEQSSLSSTVLMEPYVAEMKGQRELRFDPETFLSSRSSFNGFIENLFVSKERGSLLFISLEGVEKIVADHGETTLANILINVSYRIRNAGVEEKMYRYDDGIIAVYFPDRTRIQMYDTVENVADALLKPYEISGVVYHLHFKFGEYNVIGNYTASSDLFSVISKGMVQMRKLPDDYLGILGENISRVASKTSYIINLMESNYSNRAVDFRLQPIVSLQNNAIVSAELLLRLYDVLREQMLSPREVVQIVTEAKKMGKFDSLNYQTADHLYERYGSGVFRLYNFKGFSINLSSDSLQSKEWLTAVRRFLDANRVPDYFLGLEIPEEYFPEYTGMIEVWYKELKIYRLTWAVDNYRNARISPRKLRELGFTFVKFSRSFLLDAMSDPVSRGLYSSLVRDCHYNSIKVVAQGVETKEQADFVKSAGVDQVQGFYYFHPLKEDEFISAISEHHEVSGNDEGKTDEKEEESSEKERKSSRRKDKEKKGRRK